MQELMHPTDQKPIQVVRGQPSAAQPTIQNVVPQ
jgi:hypothetical protein